MGSDLTPLNVPSSQGAVQVVRFWSLVFNDCNLAETEEFGFYEFRKEKLWLAFQNMQNKSLDKKF